MLDYIHLSNLDNLKPSLLSLVPPSSACSSSDDQLLSSSLLLLTLPAALFVAL